jgi:hypothetical protein
MNEFTRPIGRSAMLVFMTLALFLSIGERAAHGQSSGISWNFDEAAGPMVHDSLGKLDDRVEGFWDRVPGVKGSALQFDGYTTRLVRAAKDVPALGNAFTVSAWVALDNYPWNWVPIVDQDADEQAGFFFGIDAFGHFGFRVEVNGVWQQLVSTARLPLKRWSRVTATFDPSFGLTLYLDGVQAGALKTEGAFIQAENTDLIVGRVRTPILPFASLQIHPDNAVNYSLDGYLDELEIVTGSRSASDELAAFEAAKAPDREVIPYAVLPSGPPGAGPFGAFYATLKYTKTWDRPRRFGPSSDVVVRFEKSPMRLVFWQGTNFVPAWVTGNGKWYTDEFLEAWSSLCPDNGDCEPMSDKQSRYSHVSILESSPARAVIHWRYALTEARNYKGSAADPDTGWFDWVDEYWTVYPDGVAIRKQMLWSSKIDNKDQGYEWQETIVIHGPGQRPEDNIEANALTLENMHGDIHTYHWTPKADQSLDNTKGPGQLDQPADANIQIVNLKAEERPFEIVWTKGNRFAPFHAHKSYSMFGWWNHWPVAQIPSSGRLAVADDRASHSSLSHIFWDPYSMTDRTETKLLMCGLTSQPPPQLLPLAKSWLSPPELKAIGVEVLSSEYDPSQRAFVVQLKHSAKPSTVVLTLDASSQSPLVNPAFVIENWSGDAKVWINGQPAKSAGSVHIGSSYSIEHEDLVLWMQLSSQERTVIRIEPALSDRSGRPVSD